ncbi:MAG: WYL domain-containing protein [Opitutales bacterium]
MSAAPLSSPHDIDPVKSPVTQLFRHENLLQEIIDAEAEERNATPRALAKYLQVTERTLRRMVRRLRSDHEIEYDRTLKRYRWKGRKSPAGPGAAEQLTSWDVGMALLLADAAGKDHPAGRRLVDHLRQHGVPTHLLSTHLPLSALDLGRGVEAVPDDVFRVILGAAATGRSLKGYYRKAQSRVSRRRHFLPRHICLLSGRWTAISYDFERKDHRNFLVGRFTSAPSFDAAVDASQLPPFEVGKYLANDFGRFHGEEAMEVVLRFESEAMASLQERCWRSGQEIERLEDGSGRLRFTVTHLADVCRWILSWGGAACVESPAELREMVGREARRILTAHEL